MAAAAVAQVVQPQLFLLLLELRVLWLLIIIIVVLDSLMMEGRVYALYALR